MQKEQNFNIPTIQGIQKQWQTIGQDYSQMDASPQTYYYTLANMLRLDSAKNILQIACGSGRLLPLAIDLKNPNATYYATDISDKMLKILDQRLRHHFQKYQSKISFQQWIQKCHLKIRKVNGEEPLHQQLPQESEQSLKKFDRIIANLVLMLTSDPQKMLKNLADHSVKNCLFGLTVWGNKEFNTFHTIFPELEKQYGFPTAPQSRSNFHLYKKVAQLASKTGWELVLNWQQNVVMSTLEAEFFRSYAHLATKNMKHLNEDQQKKLQNGFIDRIKQIMQSHKPITFSGECYILKKV